MQAAEQLCLIDFTDEQTLRQEPNIVDALLDVHHGDYRSVIEELLADADFYREQLFIASQLMSKGFGRGWRPKYERV